MATDGTRMIDEAREDAGAQPVPPATRYPVRRKSAAKAKGPARPILERVNLDSPFFDDKNRAFWLLQSAGWTGYFILRSLNGIANSMGLMFLVHTLLLTATGYSLTLLMASLYRRLITMR